MQIPKLSRRRLEQILLIVFLVVAYRYISRRQGPNLVGKSVDQSKTIVEIANDGAANVAKPSLVIADLLKNNMATVFVFTASWCSTCKAEAPQLNRMFQETRSKGVPFYAVHLDDTEGDALGFSLKHQYQFHITMDHSGAFATSVDVRAVPQFIIVDQVGQIRYHLRGPIQTANFEMVKSAVLADYQPSPKSEK